MPIYVDPKRKKRHVPLEDVAKPPEQQHWFDIRPLTAAEWEQRKDLCREIDEVSGRTRINLGAWTMATVRFGLAGAGGPAGPLPFSTDQASGYVSDEFLDTIHPEMRRELANAIDALSRLDFNDVKS